MCGIVGYIGKKNAKDVVLKSLKRMEYRGYDSAGIALFNKNTNSFEVYKDKGRISDIEPLVPNIVSNFGIGHTRWATHGVPSKINSHPHYSASKRFIIVHNGVVDNYIKLKIDRLYNFNFISETDTEVIANLIEFYYSELKNLSENRVEVAIRKALSVIEGAYALVIVDTKDANKFYIAKNKAPLFVGKNKDGVIVSSDSLSLVNYADSYMMIEDLTFGIIKDNSIILYDILGYPKEVNLILFNNEENIADKGLYEHFMLKEIDEQPSVIRNILQNYFKGEKILIDEVILDKIRKSSKINIIACGSSYYAGKIGEYYFNQLAEIETQAYIASEFSFTNKKNLKNEMFIFISQSGETADTIKILRECKNKGYHTLALLNEKKSAMDYLADDTLYLWAKKEVAVASTKVFVAEVVVLSILAKAVSQKRTNLKMNLDKVQQAIEKVLNAKEHIKKIIDHIERPTNVFYIGRGLDYYVSLEAALKLKEISYIHSEGIPSGELKHGTIALVENETPVVAIITQSEYNLATRNNLHETQARGAKTFVIASYQLKESNDDVTIPDVAEYLSPIVAVVVVQLIAYYAAIRMGNDVDKPRNLAKSVTVE